MIKHCHQDLVDLELGAFPQKSPRRYFCFDNLPSIIVPKYLEDSTIPVQWLSITVLSGVG